MNAERAVLGMATLFGELPQDFERRSLTEEWPLLADEFRAFVALGLTVPLKLNHDAILLSRGGMLPSVGTVRHMRLIEGHPTVPDGILALADLDEGDIADSILADLRRERWGMSLGTTAVFDTARWGAARVIREVSLTLSPAFDRCRVIGVGVEAVSRWELVTGETVATGAPT